MNTWPKGIRKAINQSKHKVWNDNNYPGTRQFCSICNNPTERCEEDSIYLNEDSEPICENCFIKYKNKSFKKEIVQ